MTRSAPLMGVRVSFPIPLFLNMISTTFLGIKFGFRLFFKPQGLDSKPGTGGVFWHENSLAKVSNLQAAIQPTSEFAEVSFPVCGLSSGTNAGLSCSCETK